PGVGTMPHLAGELLKHRAGIEITHVPYRGIAASAMSDLIAGRIDAMFNATGSLMQAVRAGHLRGLAVTSAQRFPLVREFPTITESGLPDFDVSSWYALLVPARTPSEIVSKMNADTVAILREPAVQAKFAPLGVVLVGSSAAELAGRLRAEI